MKIVTLTNREYQTMIHTLKEAQELSEKTHTENKLLKELNRVKDNVVLADFIGSFSLSEIWKMAQKYNCSDFVQIVKELKELNDL